MYASTVSPCHFCRYSGARCPEYCARPSWIPLDATDTWEWHAYSNAHFEIDGQDHAFGTRVARTGAAVSSFPVRDHARTGLMMARGGRWNDQAVAADFLGSGIANTRAPSIANTATCGGSTPAGAHYDRAPESSYFAIGAGQSTIWIEPEYDLVMVTRWNDEAKVNALIGAVMDSVAWRRRAAIRILRGDGARMIEKRLSRHDRD